VHAAATTSSMRRRSSQARWPRCKTPLFLWRPLAAGGNGCRTLADQGGPGGQGPEFTKAMRLGQILVR
jgi:hypothetical protein